MHFGEPPPIPASGDVWRELIDECNDDTLRELFVLRRQMGIDKYGTPLQRGNGRNHRQDLLEELLDAVAYARAGGFEAVERCLIVLLGEVAGDV